MKITNLLYWCLLVVTLSSCKSIDTLPEVYQLGNSIGGANITVNELGGNVKEGELISVEPSTVFILAFTKDHPKGKILELKKSNIISFRLQFANAPNYRPYYLLYTLACVPSGFFFPLTTIGNLIGVASIQWSANADVEISSSQGSWSDIKKFARYPQGIPPSIQLEEIH